MGHLTYISQYQTLITCQCCCCNGCWQLQTMEHAILQSERSCFLIPAGKMVMETSSNNPNEKRHRHISLCCNLSWGWLDLRGLVQCGGQERILDKESWYLKTQVLETIRGKLVINLHYISSISHPSTPSAKVYHGLSICDLDLSHSMKWAQAHLKQMRLHTDDERLLGHGTCYEKTKWRRTTGCSETPNARNPSMLADLYW